MADAASLSSRAALLRVSGSSTQFGLTTSEVEQAVCVLLGAVWSFNINGITHEVGTAGLQSCKKGGEERGKGYEGSDNRDRQRPTLMLRNGEKTAPRRVLPHTSAVRVYTTEYCHPEAEDSKKGERQGHVEEGRAKVRHLRSRLARSKATKCSDLSCPMPRAVRQSDRGSRTGTPHRPAEQ